MTKEITPKDAYSVDFDRLFPPMQDVTTMLVACRRTDYSASSIARAVEDCNAQVLNLNVTSLETTDVRDIVVSLRVNHRSSESVVRSLSRYGYEVISAHSSDEADGELMRLRANEVLHYLNM